MLAEEAETRRQHDRVERFREWHFAKVIEKHVLRAIGRARQKLAAAILIEATARGMPARREARALRHERRRHTMATRTQAAARAMPARKEARHLRQARGATSVLTRTVALTLTRATALTLTRTAALSLSLPLPLTVALNCGRSVVRRGCKARGGAS